MKHSSLLSFLAALLTPVSVGLASAPSNPIMYVTQTPLPDEILTHVVSETKMGIVSTMQSPLADPAHAPRGGALWIRYPGALSASNPRNLTLAAGYGGAVDANNNATGFQGTNSIAVHRPFMHWSGTKAIFSMVVGAPTSASDATVFHWQLYEITNFSQGQTPVIALVQGQPTSYNNTEACYDTQDRIIFVSDAPRGMQAHLYPQLDEYMNTPTNTGLWRLDRANSNELKHLIHAPSGAFTPFIDSAGRVLFVQWDHLTRDVSAVYDRFPFQFSATQTGIYFTNDPSDPRIETGSWTTPQGNGNGTFASEAVGAPFTLGTNANFAQFNNYPEPRNFDKVSLYGMGVFNVTAQNTYGTPIFNGNALNQFFLWECHEDGSSHETINHVGRHEFGGSNLRKGRNDDVNIVDPTFTQPTALDFLHVMESPTTPGTFYACNPPELGTHMAGPIFKFTGGTAVNPSAMQITQVTPNNQPPPPILPALTNPINIYRNPVALTDGQLMAVHAAVKQYDANSGTATSPKSNYDFKMKMLTGSVGSMVPDGSVTLTNEQPVTNINYWANGTLITYTGANLWELDPVEVVSRMAPAPATTSIASVEQTVFTEEGVDLPTMQKYLRNNNLAMVVNRNSTRRDSADKQQPFNLKVSWSSTQTTGATGTVYDIGWVQLMQADAIRGFTLGNSSPQPGRRVLPIPLHDTVNEMPAKAGAPSGSVKIGDDGSWAAILPANRAMTWHMLDGAGTKSQVKERYWVSFAPGEVRTCAVCHGVNVQDQAGNLGVPSNKPNALRELLQFWKSNNPPGSMQHASASASAVKSAGTVTLPVKRSGGSIGPVSVTYATAGGTAIAGTDYISATGTLTWADGDTADKNITVTLLNPSTIGTSKTVNVTLTNPVNGSLGATTTNTLSIDETPFNSWLFANLGAASNTAHGAPDADADSDGLANLMEYALGSLPGNSSSTTKPNGALQGTHLEMSFTRVRTDVTYTVEVSDDLVTWTAGSSYSGSGSVLNTAATTDVTPNGQPAGYTVVRDNTAGAPGVHRFMRLRATMP